MNYDSDHMDQVTEGLGSKSAKIRALARAGYGRSEIKNFMGVRYQFVRNVLVEEERRNQAISNSTTGLPGVSRDESTAPSEEGSMIKLRVQAEGCVVLPRTFRDVLMIKEGDVLIASLENGELRLLTVSAAIRRAQTIVRQFVPEGVSLVEELLEDRRREVEREQQQA